MATATIQCYFNKIKLFKSFTNKSYLYNCANIINHNNDNKNLHLSRRDISTSTTIVSDNHRLDATNSLPLSSPSFENRRKYYHSNNHSLNQQLHWTIKNSIINGAPITSSATTTTLTSSNLLQNLKIPQHQRKYYCSSANNNEFESKKPNRLPELMEFPKIVWPSIIKSIKNWILVNLIIRPYFDKDFNISDFSSGTRHALQVTQFINLSF